MSAVPLAGLLLMAMDPSGQVTPPPPPSASAVLNVPAATILLPSPPFVLTDSENAATPTHGEAQSGGTTSTDPAVVPSPDGFAVAVSSASTNATFSTADDRQTDIVVTGDRHVPSDPLHGANAVSFEATQAVDKAVIGPVAIAYKRALPSPVRSGVRNVLANLREPTVAIAYLLQLKPGKSAETLGRLAINSTIGLAGLFDIAKRRPFNLPRRRNGFADTLGYYGVKPGAFLFLPLIGPTSVRDLFGDTLDQLFLPTVVGRPFSRRAFALPANLLRSLDYRAEFDEQLHAMRDDNPDAYTTLRNHYLHQRQAEIDGLHRQHRTEPLPPATLQTASAQAPPGSAPPPVPAIDPVEALSPSDIPAVADR